MQPVWYTVKEVAEMFRVCEQTVRNWIKGIFYDKGKARAYKSDIRLKATKSFALPHRTLSDSGEISDVDKRTGIRA